MIDNKSIIIIIIIIKTRWKLKDEWYTNYVECEMMWVDDD